MKSYPLTLTRNEEFKTPIWVAEEKSFVKELNKASDPYIKRAKEHLAPVIKKRNKTFGDKKEAGYVFHSTSLLQDPKFSDLATYVTQTSNNLLIEMGYDLTNYVVFCTELWVQEFPKIGSGYHTPHTHWNGHISGFYFLKSSKKTSRPIFYDPRIGKEMIGLPEVNKENITYGSPSINYGCEPGTMIFFPSYLTHEFPPDLGYDTFRFIHWNCQAIYKPALDSYKNV
jgi:uncharacterized protein (TIGR02466 family)